MPFGQPLVAGTRQQGLQRLAIGLNAEGPGNIGKGGEFHEAILIVRVYQCRQTGHHCGLTQTPKTGIFEMVFPHCARAYTVDEFEEMKTGASLSG